jgi:hypothetical protein
MNSNIKEHVVLRSQLSTYFTLWLVEIVAAEVHVQVGGIRRETKHLCNKDCLLSIICIV